MKLAALALGLALGLPLAGPAAPAPPAGGLNAADLARVGVRAPPGAALPLGLAMRDDAGRPTTLGGAVDGEPTVLVFADYACTTLCGPALSMTAAGLTASRLAPGRDFRVAVIGLDPNSTAAQAQAFRHSRLDGEPALSAASTLMTGSAGAIAQATAAVGYGYVRDPASGQYTHPAVAFVLQPTGRVSRVLSQIGLRGEDLRLALVEAGQGRVGSLVDRLNLLCHGFDPARGVYDNLVQGWLRVGGVATVLLMAGGLAALSLKRRRAAA